MVEWWYCAARIADEGRDMELVLADNQIGERFMKAGDSD